MLTYSERIKLRDKLTSGEIEIEFAQEQFWKHFKEGNKSWHTKDWNERRDKLIKDKCQMCNSKDTLTMMGRPQSTDITNYGSEISETWKYKGSNKYIDEFTIEFTNGELKSVSLYKDH